LSISRQGGWITKLIGGQPTRFPGRGRPNLVTIAANVALCKSVYTVPAGRIFIIKTIHMTPAGAAGNNSEVSVYANGTCTGPTLAQGLVYDSSGGATNDDIDLGPGAVVKAGSSISIATNNTWADVHLYGYLTP